MEKAVFWCTFQYFQYGMATLTQLKYLKIKIRKKSLDKVHRIGKKPKINEHPSFH